jgi:two-component system response regulator HydG
MDGKIWICDDEVGMLRYLKKMLQNWGLNVVTFDSPKSLLERFRREPQGADLLLLDIKMAGMDGLETLRLLKKQTPDQVVIMMTAHGTIESTVEAMRLGAFNYLTKPFPQENLFSLVQQCLERKLLLEENLKLKEQIRTAQGEPDVVFESTRFREVYDLALRVASVNSPVLILGESGTGKELIAKTIHRNGPYRQKKFLAINCAALTETLLESQLFGHIKGAFTGAVQTKKGLLDEANGGTLFLDEIGDLSPSLQAKLLRVLQEGEFIPVGATEARFVDVRFMAATNKDLEREVLQGRFREDLYYRLNVITLTLPPLRDRPEDIRALVPHFLAKVAVKFNQTTKQFTLDALALLENYHWPGNVRELENTVERCVIMARGEIIDRDQLPIWNDGNLPRESPSQLISMNLRDAERVQVQRALIETSWNKSKAAGLLGVTRKTLDKKIRDYSLTQGSAQEKS